MRRACSLIAFVSLSVLAACAAPASTVSEDALGGQASAASGCSAGLPLPACTTAQDPSRWRERAFAPLPGPFAFGDVELRVDPQGVLHAAIVRGPTLLYGTLNGGVWSASPAVDLTGSSDSIEDVDLDVDACGTPSLLYRRGVGADRRLFLARRVGASFVSEEVPLPEPEWDFPRHDLDVAAHTVDSMGKAFVVARRHPSLVPTFLVRTASAWRPEELPTGTGSFDMAVAPSGPVIVTQDARTGARTGRPVVLLRENGGWVDETIPGARVMASGVAGDPNVRVAVDDGGGLHVAWIGVTLQSERDPMGFKLQYAMRSAAGVWSAVDTLAESAFQQRDLTLDVGSAGEPVIGFSDGVGVSTVAHVALRRGGRWIEAARLAPTGAPPLATAVDASGRVHALLPGETSTRWLTLECAP